MTLLQFIEREITNCGGIGATLAIIERERAGYIYIAPANKTCEVFRAAHLLDKETKRPPVKRKYKTRAPVIRAETPKKEIWTTEKVVYLLKNYHRLNNMDLAVKLHFSPYTISRKMIELELKRPARINIAHTPREAELDDKYGGWF